MSVRLQSVCFISVLTLAACSTGSDTPPGGPDGASPPGDDGPPDSGASPPDAPPRPDAAAPVADAAPPDAAPVSCDPASLAPGDDEDIDLMFDGRTRRYNVHVGDAVDPDVPAPLVLNFHGANNTPGLQEVFSGMKGVADDEGFVVVYPAGLSNSFNAGSCCGNSALLGVDDLGFSRAIVEDVSERACIDARRVYATGFSNGGYMSHLLACRASDLFAAVAPVAGAMGISSCNPERPVPVIAFHGTADFVVSYNDGKGATEGWAERNGCDGSPERESFGSSYCDRWLGCDGEAEVQFCSVSGWSHLWPNGFTAIPATPRIWDFFSQHQLPMADAL